MPRRVIAVPRDEDVPASPMLAHRCKMLPHKVTVAPGHIVHGTLQEEDHHDCARPGGRPATLLPSRVNAANTRAFRARRRQAGRWCSRGYEFFPVDGTPGTTGASGPIHTAQPSRQNTAYWPSLRLRSSASATARFRTSNTMASYSCPCIMSQVASGRTGPTRPCPMIDHQLEGVGHSFTPTRRRLRRLV